MEIGCEREGRKAMKCTMWRADGVREREVYKRTKEQGGLVGFSCYGLCHTLLELKQSFALKAIHLIFQNEVHCLKLLG